MKQSLQVIENYRFGAEDFVGGEAALDFVNTVSGRDESAPRDRLDSYERLLDWAAHANLLPGKRLRALARHAQSDPGGAARALERAKRLREALFAIVSALAAGRSPPARGARSPARTLARRRDGAGISLRRGPVLAGRRGGGRRPRPDRGDHRLAHGQRGVAGARRPAAHLPGPGLRLDFHRPLEGGPPPLVRHGGLRQRREVAAPLRAVRAR